MTVPGSPGRTVASMDAGRTRATNQPAPLVGANLVTGDAGLLAALDRWQTDPIAETLAELGAVGATAEAREHGLTANRNLPTLRTFDRYGNRIDEVEFHPSWHWLMGHAVAFGLHASPWVEGDPQAHLRRAAGFYAWSQVEMGHGCPISMTYSAVPALRADAGLTDLWTPLLASRRYDPVLVEPSAKSGALAGMGMTEKQGGSDVRSNVTTATSLDVDGEYLLTGHKWFCSAPMNDVFLVLAQATDGLTCFVVPRVMPDGTRNVFRLQRLKDKLGNRSNASAEVEFERTWAQQLGEEGRGVATIIEMVAATRLDCVLGSAAIMRRAVAEATWHCSRRHAFGRTLIDQPLMTNVLADLAIESEAATVLGMRLATCLDSPADETEQALRRIALPLAKYWVCKRTPLVAVEAAECLGGNGYVEESGMPLLVRESPLNSIWEGSGNINALDVVRALHSSPTCLEAWLQPVAKAKGGHPALDAAYNETLTMLGELEGAEPRARRLTSLMAVCLQAALLFEVGSDLVAEQFCASRLGDRGPSGLGHLSAPVADLRAIVERALPQLDEEPDD
jgi:putative acyl-CoA dehydrogenase